MKTFKRKFQFVAIALIISIAACTSNTKSNDQTDAGKTTQNIVNKTDIHAAAITGNTDVVKEYIKSGADLNVTEAMGGSTPLISASVFGKTEVAKLLIEAGANLNAQNNEGSTALHSAAFFCHVDIVKLLIENNADQSIKNKYKSTPIESVIGSYDQLHPIYLHFAKELKPLGLNLDLTYIEKTRPVIAEMLVD